MQLNEWFDRAISIEEFENTFDKLKSGYEKIYNEFDLPNDEDFFKELSQKNFRALIIAEPWCEHCMLNIPIVLKILQKANIETRFALRDQNIELIDAYLTNGNRVIPKMIFIDQDGNEIGVWGPLAPATKALVDPYREELPPKDTPRYEKAFQLFIQQLHEAFINNTKLWDEIYKDMKQTLQQI